MYMWCFTKPLSPRNLISDFSHKSLMSTYYVLAQDPTLEGANKSLKICPALDCLLPVALSSGPVPNTVSKTQAMLMSGCLAKCYRM